MKTKMWEDRSPVAIRSDEKLNKSREKIRVEWVRNYYANIAFFEFVYRVRHECAIFASAHRIYEYGFIELSPKIFRANCLDMVVSIIVNKTTIMYAVRYLRGTSCFLFAVFHQFRQYFSYFLFESPVIVRFACTVQFFPRARITFGKLNAAETIANLLLSCFFLRFSLSILYVLIVCPKLRYSGVSTHVPVSERLSFVSIKRIYVPHFHRREMRTTTDTATASETAGHAAQSILLMAQRKMISFYYRLVN